MEDRLTEERLRRARQLRNERLSASKKALDSGREGIHRPRDRLQFVFDEADREGSTEKTNGFRKETAGPSHRVLGNQRRGLNVDDVLNSLREDRPQDNVGRHYHEYTIRMQDHANVTQFLQKNGQSRRVVEWVLKRLPDECGLGWLLLESTKELLKDMMCTQHYDETFRITQYELNQLFVVLDKERSYRRNNEVRDKEQRNEARDNTQRSAEQELLSLLGKVAPKATDVQLQRIAKHLQMSVSSLRSKTLDQFDTKIMWMHLNTADKKIVRDAYESARSAQVGGGKRARTDDSYTPNPYFV